MYKVGIVVQKYGGSSVADINKVMNVSKKIIKSKEQGNDVVVVVSAMGKTTDNLIDMINEITEYPSPREMDVLMSTGEQVSMAVMSIALQSQGYNTVSLTGIQAGIKTSNVHRKARILTIKPDRIFKEFEKGNIVIVAGFQGINEENDITTLGRGGSDTTAVAIAAALNADVCEIYTDVDGVYTTNPKLTKKARKLDSVSYDEMLEMANLGAQVLQPRAVEFAKNHNVKIAVRCSFSDEEGTYVMDTNNMERNLLVTGVAYDTDVAKIAVLDVPDKPGIAEKLFSSLADEAINVDIIVQGVKGEAVTDILFTVSKDDLALTKKVLGKIIEDLGASDFICEEGLSKISIIGAGMASNPGVASKMFKALSSENVNIQAISTSEIRISCIIGGNDTEKAVLAIHKEFELDND